MHLKKKNPSPSQPHSQEKDGEEERGDRNALPAEGRGRRSGPRRAGVQQEGKTRRLSHSFFSRLTGGVCILTRSRAEFLKYSRWPKRCVCVCAFVCVCVCVSVFTETIRRLFEQAAEDGHVPQIPPYCE